MKTILVLSLLFSLGAWAKGPSLFVKDGAKLLDVEELIKNGDDVQAVYGFEAFCYQGEVNTVMAKIATWNKKGSFFSGDGGGFKLKKIGVNRGIVSYDITLKFEDEVVPGEFQTVIVKPCSFRRLDRR